MTLWPGEGLGKKNVTFWHFFHFFSKIWRKLAKFGQFGGPKCQFRDFRGPNCQLLTLSGSQRENGRSQEKNSTFPREIWQILTLFWVSRGTLPGQADLAELTAIPGCIPGIARMAPRTSKFGAPDDFFLTPDEKKHVFFDFFWVCQIFENFEKSTKIWTLQKSATLIIGLFLKKSEKTGPPLTRSSIYRGVFFRKFRVFFQKFTKISQKNTVTLAEKNALFFGQFLSKNSSSSRFVQKMPLLNVFFTVFELLDVKNILIVIIIFKIRCHRLRIAAWADCDIGWQIFFWQSSTSAVERRSQVKKQTMPTTMRETKDIEVVGREDGNMPPAM